MRSAVARLGWYGLGLAVMVHSIGGSLLAGGPAAPAPEIDGSSISTGVGLLAAAVLILRSRWRSK